MPKTFPPIYAVICTQIDNGNKTLAIDHNGISILSINREYLRKFCNKANAFADGERFDIERVSVVPNFQNHY